MVKQVGFPDGSAGKESTFNARDIGNSGSIPCWEDVLEKETAAH